MNEEKKKLPEIVYFPIGKIKLNPDNPRQIKTRDFNSLVKSLESAPEMFRARPLLVSDRTGELVVIGGNMRLRAAQKLKYGTVPAIVLSGLTEAKEKEIAIKDNGSWGEWDFDALANAWSDLPLSEWGIAVPIVDDPDDPDYSRKIESPAYEPNGKKENIEDLVDQARTKALLAEIDRARIDDDVKTFLRLAAARHLVFNYARIANFYCNASKPVQTLMEKSALVIIDYKKAIEYGFTKLTEELGAASDENEK